MVNSYLYREGCSNILFQISTIFDSRFLSYTQEVESSLSELISGSGEQPLNPKILDLETLKAIIATHGVLNNTIYLTQPALLYSLAKVNLVGVDTEFSQTHLVLRIPLLETQQKLYQVYNVNQVGLNMGDGKCGRFSVPSFLYRLEDRLHPFDKEACEVHNSLFVCASKDLSHAQSCIQADNVTCAMYTSHCHTTHEYKVSKSGALLRNNLDSDTFAINVDGWTSQVSRSTHGIAFVSWAEHRYLQIGDVKLVSPSYTPAPFTPMYLSTPISTLEKVGSEELAEIFQSLESAAEVPVEELINDKFEPYPLGLSSKFPRVWMITITAIILVMMCVHLKTLIMFSSNAQNTP